MSVLPYCEEELLYYEDCVDRECKSCFDPDYDCCYPNDVILLRGPRGIRGPCGGIIPASVVCAYTNEDVEIGNAIIGTTTSIPITIDTVEPGSTQGGWTLCGTTLVPGAYSVGTSNVIMRGTFNNPSERHAKVTMWMQDGDTVVPISQSTSTIPGIDNPTGSVAGQIVSNFMHKFTGPVQFVVQAEIPNMRGYTSDWAWFTVTIDRVY